MTSPTKLLIVDDDSDTTYALKIGLEARDFKVDVYNNPKDVLKNFKPNFYYLAIIDVRLPKMSGFRLFNELSKKDKKLKVCFITSFQTYFKTLNSEYPHIDHTCFFKKPISVNEIAKHIKKMI